MMIPQIIELEDVTIDVVNRTITDKVTNETRPFNDDENAVFPLYENIVARQAEVEQLASIAEQKYAAAMNAIQSNVNFLAIQSPNNAQAIAQIKALTQQMNAVIKTLARSLQDD